MTSRFTNWKILLPGIIGIVALAAVACGSGGDSAADLEETVKVRTFDRTLTIADFEAIGLKANKQYDVTGLPQGLDAWRGFWGPNPSSRNDYEIRFYESHAIANGTGAALAEEATGDEFAETRDSQTWTEGVKDRWQARGVTDVSSAGSRQAPGPTYADWVILGNTAILCTGLDSAQALERCKALGDELLGPQ